MLYGIAAATAALFLTAVLAALLRSLALRLGPRFGLVERRRLRRVPLLGGLAVVAGTGVVAGAGDWCGVAPLGADGGGPLLAGIAVGALGLVMDVRAVPLPVRLLVVAGAAAWTVPYGELGPALGALAVGWIAFVTFAFASLDHADGVMGTVAVVTAFALSGCAAAEMMDGLAALLSVLAAALTGFLMQNWPPARIVSGRCGALFTGFVLASAAVLVHAGRGAGVSAGAMFALTAVASVDVVLVLVARRRSGHLAHRLRRLGLTARGATVVVGVASFAGAFVGLMIHLGWLGATAALWVAGGAALVVLGLSLVPGVRAVDARRNPRSAPTCV